MNCPKCGHPARDKAKVCVKCGSSLTKSPLASRSRPTHRAGAPAFLRPGQGGNSIADKLFNPKDFSAATARQQIPLAKQSKSTYLIIWATMFAALPIYCVVWRLVTQGKNSMSEIPESSVFAFALAVIAVLCLGAGLIVASQSLSPARLCFSDNKDMLTQNIYTNGIISLALIESVAIYGLVMVFVGYNTLFFFPFVASAAVGQLIHLKFALDAWRFHAAIPDDPPQN